MIRNILGAGILLLVPSTAMADCKPTSVSGVLECGKQLTGNPDLDRAMSICAKHQVESPFRYPEGGAPPAYAAGWSPCLIIRAEWEKSDVARQQREAHEQDARDNAFVRDYARSLNKEK